MGEFGRVPKFIGGGPNDPTGQTQQTRQTRLEVRGRAHPATRTNIRSVTRSDTAPASDPSCERHANRHLRGMDPREAATRIGPRSSRGARSLPPLTVVSTRERLCPRIVSPPPSRGCARSRSCGVLDSADHGPGRQCEDVARGERDLDDAVRMRLDHERAAADRPVGERNDDCGQARGERGGGDDAWGSHGVTRSSA